MTTKKLLVAFDPKQPHQESSDFLVIVMEGTQPELLGVRSKKPVVSGLMVYLGKQIMATDLFAKLVDSGWKIESEAQTVRTLESYIQKLQEFRIGNLLSVEADAANGFKLVKLADSPPSTNVSKLP
jgi:hypothetical protein